MAQLLGVIYGKRREDGAATAHQLFVKGLTYGYWREHYEYSHGTFQGLLRTAMSLLRTRYAARKSA